MFFSSQLLGAETWKCCNLFVMSSNHLCFCSVFQKWNIFFHVFKKTAAFRIVIFFRWLNNSGSTSHLSSVENPDWLGYIRDEILPSYIGIIIIHYKDPYQPTSIMECQGRVFITAHLESWGQSSFGILYLSVLALGRSVPLARDGAKGKKNFSELSGWLQPEVSGEQWKKPWLVVWYRGLYYPIIWGL